MYEPSETETETFARVHESTRLSRTPKELTRIATSATRAAVPARFGLGIPCPARPRTHVGMRHKWPPRRRDEQGKRPNPKVMDDSQYSRRERLQPQGEARNAASDR
jgi:hypothetical protein